jgi:hypothetical protein
VFDVPMLKLFCLGVIDCIKKKKIILHQNVNCSYLLHVHVYTVIIC